MLEVGRRARGGATGLVRALGGGVIVLTLLFVRGAFGLLFGGLFGIGLILASRRLSRRANGTILTVLGLTSCLYAVLDIKSDVLDRPELASDARMLAELTGIPTTAWGVLWVAVALMVSATLLLRAYRSA
jgi:hypothetical protein